MILPAMQRPWLGWNNPLEKEKAVHSSIRPEEFNGLYGPWGRKESDMKIQVKHFGKEHNICDSMWCVLTIASIRSI